MNIHFRRTSSIKLVTPFVFVALDRVMSSFMEKRMCHNMWCTGLQ